MRFRRHQLRRTVDGLTECGGLRCLRLPFEPPQLEGGLVHTHRLLDGAPWGRLEGRVIPSTTSTCLSQSAIPPRPVPQTENTRGFAAPPRDAMRRVRLCMARCCAWPALAAPIAAPQCPGPSTTSARHRRTQLTWCCISNGRPGVCPSLRRGACSGTKVTGCWGKRLRISGPSPDVPPTQLSNLTPTGGWEGWLRGWLCVSC